MKFSLVIYNEQHLYDVKCTNLALPILYINNTPIIIMNQGNAAS